MAYIETTMKIDKSRFHGIFPALVTPYTRDGAIHEESPRKFVSVNLEKGVRGFYVDENSGHLLGGT